MRLSFSSIKEQREAVTVLRDSKLVTLVPDAKDHFAVYIFEKYDANNPANCFLGHVRKTNMTLFEHPLSRDEMDYASRIRTIRGLDWKS